VQVVQPLVEERGQDLVFFHEKRGFGHDDELHLVICYYLSICKSNHFMPFVQ
jgi:hypothetical protein